jgi:hypothetical protein
MLKNGNFEQDWGKSHEVLVCRPGRTPTLEIRDNIFTPESWLTWFYHKPGEYDQPEVKDAWKHVDPRRVHTGEKGVLFFTFYRRHWGGLLQQVSVEPGKRYEAKVHAHAWSNHDDTGFPHPHDGRWSEGAGYDEVAWAEGTQPHDTGDPQQDAKANFTFSVGIDPTGGLDPMSDDVIWGDGYHIYNGYVKPITVKATAQENVITVFLRSKTLWTFCHSDAYFDDAILVKIEDEPGAYDCVTLVLPQDATQEQLGEILRSAYPKKRSFMFSHDDAGRLGGLAQLYNILNIDKQRYLDWYSTRYPLTTVEFTYTSDWDEEPPPPPPQGNPISLHLQSMDPGWDTYLRGAKPNVIKVLASMHDVVGVKRVAPDTTVIWRHVDNNYDGILDNPDPHVGARRWIAKFRDSLYARCAEIERDCPGVKPPYFYVESINEVYPSRNATAVTRAVNFDIAFIEELNALNLPIRAVVFTAGIGNPHESEYPLLGPLARIAEQYGALMGYHNYFWVDHGVSHLDSDWEWHAGRWAWIDEIFVQHGIHVTWFGAESGAHFSCVDGWRAPTCFDGDWDAYEASLVHLRDKIVRWNNAHDNRYLGLVLFSTGLGLGWDSWHIGHTEMERLARALTT